MIIMHQEEREHHDVVALIEAETQHLLVDQQNCNHADCPQRTANVKRIELPSLTGERHIPNQRHADTLLLLTQPVDVKSQTKILE